MTACGKIDVSCRISAQIRDMRKDRGWTQQQLSDAINTSKTFVSTLESDDYDGYSLCTLNKIAKAFGVGLSISFGDKYEDSGVDIR